MLSNVLERKLNHLSPSNPPTITGKPVVPLLNFKKIQILHFTLISLQVIGQIFPFGSGKEGRAEYPFYGPHGASCSEKVFEVRITENILYIKEEINI